jgi:hypothetical protein
VEGGVWEDQVWVSACGLEESSKGEECILAVLLDGAPDIILDFGKVIQHAYKDVRLPVY